MKALALLRPDSGVAAMQSINVTVLNPLFLCLFLGTAPGAVRVWRDYVAGWTRAPYPYLRGARNHDKQEFL